MLDMSASGKKSALDKALAVLEAVTEQRQAVGLPDLAARLNLPRQTVHRLLGQLEEAGLVRRDPARERYSVGPRQSRLALASLVSRNQGAPMRLVLQDLVGEINETCNIGVLDDLDYIYIERIECSWPLRTHLEAGSRIGAHANSGGKLMLAQVDPEALRRILKGRKLKAYTRHTLVKPSDLLAELDLVRKQDYALNREELFDGIVGIAVPIRARDSRVLAALAIHGPLARLDLKKCEAMLPKLRKAAAKIADVWFD